MESESLATCRVSVEPECAGSEGFKCPVLWEISPHVVHEIWNSAGSFVPLFADASSCFAPEDCVKMAPLDSNFSQADFCGKKTLVHVPHAKLPLVLDLYLSQKLKSPHNTSAVFIVPEWPTRKWFSRLAHFTVLKRYSIGSKIFSAPLSDSSSRRRYGPCKWATLILYDPPISSSREPDIPDLAAGALPSLSALGQAKGGRRNEPPQHTSALCGQLAKLPHLFLSFCSTVLFWLFGLAKACAQGALKWMGVDGRVLHMRCQIFDTTVSALIDSGASRSFINANLVKSLGVKPLPTAHSVQVTLADKRVLDASLCLPRVKMKLEGVPTWTTLYVLEDLDDDIILGMDWLERVNPLINWSEKSVTFNGRTVFCSAEPLPKTLRSPTADVISKKQLKRLIVKGDDVFCVFLRKMDSKPSSSSSFDDLSASRCPPCIRPLLGKYKSVFDKPSGPPPDRPIKHSIPILNDQPPPPRAPYRMSTVQLDELKKQLTELMDNGFIQPSSSSYAAPVLLVPKPNGSWRFCVDYRALNLATVKSRYPLPRIDDLFQQLQGAKYFSKMDFTSGYWQIAVAPEDIHKTAFTTRYGLFEWTVMPMGLTSAPSTFQRAMNILFHDLLDKGVVVYLDDVLIYAKTLEEHNVLLEKVLSRLHEHKYFAAMSKCYFAQESIQFLGHNVSADGISPLYDRVEAVREWPRPTTVQDVRSFLGLCSFYRKFVRRFAHIASPLHALTKGSPKKHQTVVWSNACEKAFVELKDTMCSAPVLILPDPRKPFVIHTDASDFALGSVLMQHTESGLHPVEFYSRKLSGAELKYDTRVREMLTIRESCRHWEHLLAGTHTDIYTDHDTLKHFFTQRDISPRDQRWVAELQALDISIVYHQGKDNVVADALSRRPDYAATFKKLAISPTFPTLMRDLRAATKVDVECQRLAALPGYRLEDGLLKHGSSSRGARIVVPNSSSLRHLVLDECHISCGHGGMHKTLATVTRYFTWRGVAKDVKRFVRECHTCQVAKPSLAKPAGLLHPLPVPNSKFHTIGIDQVVALPESREGFDALLTVTDHLTKFVVLVPCKESDDASTIATRLFDKVFSVYGLPLEIVSDRDPKYTSRFWRSLFRILGTKVKLSTAYHPQTDGQSERTNQTVEVMLRCLCVDYGQDWVEKLSRVQFALNSNVNVSTQFSPAYLMFGYQPRGVLDVFATASSSASREANASATEMLQQMREDLELAKSRLSDAKARQKEWADRSRRHITFRVGDEVLLSTVNLDFNIPRKLKPRFVGPFPISRVVSDVAYELKLPTTMARLHPVFHVSLLKPYLRGESQPPPAPPPLLVQPDHEVFEVQAIIGHRVVGRHKKLQFRVLWKGYPLHESTWEPERNLDNCDALLSAYKHTHGL